MDRRLKNVYVDWEGDRFRLRKVERDGKWTGCWIDLSTREVSLPVHVVEKLKFELEKATRERRTAGGNR